MSNLEHVAINDPHVAAHNNERDVINGIKNLENEEFVSNLKASIDEKVSGDLPNVSTDIGATAAALFLAHLPVPAMTRAAPTFQTGSGLSDATQYGTGSVALGGTAVVRHKVIRTGAILRLVYTNFYPTSSAGATETDSPNDITVHASVEPVNGGTRIPVRVSGKIEFIVPAGGMVVSDPIGIDVKKGDYFWSWTWVSVSSGQKFPRGGFAATAANGEGFNYPTTAAVGTDVTLSGSRPTTANNYVYGPAAILVEPVDPGKAVIGLVGDSISAGTGDNQYGFVERWLADNYSLQRVPYPSEQMYKWVDNNGSTRYRRAALLGLAGVTHILAGHIRNDISTSIATLMQKAINYWTFLDRIAPGKVWAWTCTPYTSSTDSWATVANQSPFSPTDEVNRIDYNTWLRDGAPMNPTTRVPVAVGASGVRVGEAGHPLAGYLDVADIAESARDSGKWKVTGSTAWTADGIHPNSIGAAALAAGLPSPSTIFGPAST